MTSCAEIPEKTGTNAARVVVAALKNLLASGTKRLTNELHALFHRRPKPNDCSKASAHLVRRLSSPIRFKQKPSRAWNMKTCGSRRPQAAAKRGLRENKSGGSSIAGGAPGTRRH